MALKIRLVKSLSGRKKNQIATAKSLKLKRINDATVQPNNPQTSGKINCIRHLIEVNEV